MLLALAAALLATGTTHAAKGSGASAAPSAAQAIAKVRTYAHRARAQRAKGRQTFSSGRARGARRGWAVSSSPLQLLRAKPAPTGNLPPSPTTPTVTTTEGTPVAITLTATDPNGDPMTFQATSLPKQGTLTGTAPNLTYTPKRGFTGGDSFKYRVTDSKGASATGTASIQVVSKKTSVPSVTASANPLSTFVEDGAAVVIDSGLTVFDPDSTSLVGATVRILDGLQPVADELLFTNQSGITGSYNATTGVLTLTGVSSVANYQTALRSVTFASTSQTPGTSRAIELNVDDGAAAGMAANRNVNVTAVNDAPVNTVPGAQTTDEDTATSLNVSVADVDVAGGNVQTVLGVDEGTLTLATTSGLTVSGNGTDAVTLSGSVAQVTAALTGLTYTPRANFSGGDQLDVVTSDLGNSGAGGAQSDTDTVAITVTEVPDGPVNTVPGPQTTDEDTAKALTLGVADGDAGSSDLGVDLDVDHGTLTLASTAGLANLTGDGTSSVSFDGTLTEIAAALGGLTYTPNADYNGSDTLTMTSDDGTYSDTDTVALTVNAVNDAPVNALAATATLDEDDSHTFSGAGLSDVDAGTDPLEVSLAVGEGTVSLDGVSGLTFTDGDGAGDDAMTFTGAQSAVDAALSGMVYEPAADYAGADTLTLSTSDQGSTGSGGVKTDTDFTAITVTAVNDAPVNTVPGAQSAVEDTALALGTISVEDIDTDPIEVTLDVDHGALTLPATTGLSFTTGDGSGDATMVFSGAQSALNAALAGIVYTPTTGYSGADTLTVTSDDGPLSDTDTVAIAVEALNLAPVHTVPEDVQILDEDTELTFSTVNGNLIAVADADAAGDPVRTTLSVDEGALLLSTTSGLTFTDGANNSGSMTFEGTLADVNAALAGLVYGTPTNFAGADTLTITTNDLGNNGAGGAKSDTDVVAISTEAVNDAPRNSLPAAQSVAEDGTLTLSTANLNPITVSDVDHGGGTETLTLTATSGTLTLASLTGLTPVTGDGTADPVIVVVGTLAAINTALDGLTFTPDADYAGTAFIGSLIDDQGNSGSGGAKADSDNLEVTVDAVNDAPALTMPAGPRTVPENGTDTATISVADIDAGSGQVAITLGAGHGDVALATTSGLTFTDGANGSGAMTFEGTLAQVNAAMNDLTYSPDANYFGADTLTASVSDKGNTGSGGALSDSGSVAFDVEEANSAPVNSVPGSQMFDEDSSRTFSSSGGNAITISDPDALAGDDLEMRLQSTHGVLDVTASTGDLTSISGDGTNDLTVRGTASELNAVLTAWSSTRLRTTTGARTST
jgi:hypothetical protein